MHLSLLSLALFLKSSLAGTIQCPNVDTSKYVASSADSCTISKVQIVGPDSTVPTTTDDSKLLCLPLSVIQTFNDAGCMPAPLYGQMNHVCTALHLFNWQGQNMLACSQCAQGSVLNSDSKFCSKETSDLCSSGTQWLNGKIYCPPSDLAANAVPDPTGSEFVCADGYTGDLSTNKFICVAKQATVATCQCNKPGDSSDNGYKCTDNSNAYCSTTERCVATSPFNKGDWATACKPTCTCNKPGDSSDIGYKCTDITLGICPSGQKCVATSPFNKDDVKTGCAVVTTGTATIVTSLTCTCNKPNDSSDNGYKCTDNSSAYCSTTERCVATSPFNKGDWATGCKPTCTCNNPNDSSDNGYTCTDGYNAYCSSKELCASKRPFVKGQWSTGCIAN